MKQMSIRWCIVCAWERYIPLLLALALLLTGCKPAQQATDTASRVSDPSQDDYEVFTTILPAIYISNTIWVIQEKAYTTVYTTKQDWSSELDPETLADYLVVWSKPWLSP